MIDKYHGGRDILAYLLLIVTEILVAQVEEPDRRREHADGHEHRQQQAVRALNAEGAVDVGYVAAWAKRCARRGQQAVAGERGGA